MNPQENLPGCFRRKISGVALLIIVTLALTTAIRAGAAQKTGHQGTKLEGFATVVTPTSITVFDKKSEEIEIRTDKDYTSLVGIAAAVTVWYTTKDGVNHLEDIIYPQSGTFVVRNQFEDRIRRIVIVPEPGDVDNTDGLISAIGAYLQRNAGWFVAPPELGAEVASRLHAPASVLDAIDPDTGKVDVQAYVRPAGSVITNIADETHTDAVLEVQVIKVKAAVRGFVASWDDMSEPVASGKARTFSPLGAFGGRGWVDAATVEMSFWGHSGKLLWKKRRGFAVLAVQSGMTSKYHPRPLTEVYASNEKMQGWLNQTLGQIVPPTRGDSDEPSPLSPELRRQLENAKHAGDEQN